MIYCSLKCDEELITLEKIQGRQDKVERWYYNVPAKKIYEGVLRNESEVLYWWPCCYLFSIVLWMMSVILGGRKVFCPINISGAAIMISMLCICLYFVRTWQIVSMVID